MSFGTKSCTCQGNNPNCYRCDGTGLIEQAGENNPESSSGNYKNLHHMCKCSTCVPLKHSVSKTKSRNYAIFVKPSTPARKAANWKETHPCPTCVRKFQSQQSLFQHIEQKHGILPLSKSPSLPTKHDESVSIKDVATVKRITTPDQKIEIDWENYCTEPDDPWRNYVPEYPYPKTRFICPHCGIKLINEARLEKHVMKVHAFSEVPPIEIVPEPSPIITPASLAHGKLEQCPTCNQWVKNLRKHMDKAGHESRVNLQQSPENNKNGTISNGIGYRCLLCSAVMKNTQKLCAHVSRVHGVMSVAKKSQVQQQNASPHLSKTTIPKRAPDSTGNDKPNSVYERAEKMDATRGWGGSFRDHGQFGSYPLHDSMDDDSFS